MSTNYYWSYGKKPDEIFGDWHHTLDCLHIGKSSGGWCFALHVHPTLGLNNLKDWTRLIRSQDFCIRSKAVIYDEYKRRIEPADMMKIITERTATLTHRKPDGRFGSGREAWKRDLSGEDGPQGLRRAIVDGIHCIGHGEGTWDYITGDFS